MRVSTFACVCSLACGSLAQWTPPQPVFDPNGYPDWGAGAWPPTNVGIPLVPQAPGQLLQNMLSQVDPLRIQWIIQNLTNFGTRHTLSNQTDPVRGIGAARDWIATQMRSYAAASKGRMQVTVPYYTQGVASRISFPVNISNIVATIPGSGDPNRAYVITGHYDSRRIDIMNYTADAPGSDDNGSGVAVLMELARICAKQQPYATMIFAATAGEEQDLYGATFLAQTLKNASVDVEANFNNDIVGTGKNAPYDIMNEHTIRLFGAGIDYLPQEDASTQYIREYVGGENDTPARNLGRFVSEINAGAVANTDMQVALVYRQDRFFRGGDHEAFLNEGYPAVRFTEPNEDYKHQHQDPRIQNGVIYGDNIEFVDFEYTARVARVNLAAMWSIAQAPRMPTGFYYNTSIGEPAATEETPASWLGEVTNFMWNPSTDANFDHYELVWRPFSQQQWTHMMKIGGKATSITLELSKDSLVFGLRAVANNGKKSPAVYPFPQGY